jgi:GNAT superfamily N-acetyltransferase
MIDINIARPEEAERIAQVHRASWHETYDGILPVETIEAMINAGEKQQINHFRETAMGHKPEHMLLVARNDEGEVIGFCDALNGDKIGEVRAVYILREYQKHGIGSMFMKKMTEFLRNCEEVYIDLLRENIPAVRFFEHHGFAFTGNSESFSGIIIISMAKR